MKLGVPFLSQIVAKLQWVKLRGSGAATGMLFQIATCLERAAHFAMVRRCVSLPNLKCVLRIDLSTLQHLVEMFFDVFLCHCHPAAVRDSILCWLCRCTKTRACCPSWGRPGFLEERLLRVGRMSMKHVRGDQMVNLDINAAIHPAKGAVCGFGYNLKPPKKKHD